MGLDATAQTEAAVAELQARVRRQSALAELGRIALGSRDLSALLQQAVTLAAETLGVDRAAIVERVPAGGDLRVAAEPAAMSADIPGGGAPWGVLSVYTTRPRLFTPEDRAFLQSAADLVALAADRHAVEAAQLREKEMLQTVYDNIPVMISVFGGGRLQRVNPEWERALGWTLEETRKVDILAEAYPDPERRREAIEFIRRAERHWGDFQMRTRDGRPLDVSWARFALSDGSSIGFGLDITERKRVERALRESEMRFRQAVENINEVFWLWSVEGPTVLYVNRAYEEVFGRTRESVYRDARSWIEGIHPDDREMMLRAVDETRRRGGLETTYRVVRPDGSMRWLRDRAFAIRNDAGEVYRFAAVAEDITESKRAEDERAQLLASETRARREAEAALARLRAIDTITDNALQHLGLDDLLRELLVRLRRTLEADSAGVQLLDEESRSLYPRAVDGYVHEKFATIRVRVGTGVSGRIAAEGRPMIVDDYSTIDTSGIQGIDEANLRARTRSVMGAPLRIGDKVVGVVSVISSRERHFTEEELRLLLLVADRAAPAVEMARLLEKVREGGERQRALSRRLLTAHEEERRRVAVELHDELGQILTAVKINLGSLERMSRDTPAAASLSQTIASVDKAMLSVRDLALDLRPSVLDDFGLPAALRWCVDRLARDTGVHASLAIGEVPRLEPELETACFRVAQEALRNVARHARARHVWLGLGNRCAGLELSVRDDGIGFDVSAARDRARAGDSMGLLGMQERVSLLGGDLDIRRLPEGGMEVWARFPTVQRGEVTA